MNDEEIPLKELIRSDLIQCRIIQYDEYHYTEHHFQSLKELNEYLDRRCCFSDDYSTWILIEGLENAQLIEDISKRFSFHRLIEENLGEIHDRIKLHVLDDHSLIYLSMQMIYIHPEEKQIHQKQISLILKEKNVLIQFEETRSDLPSLDLFQLLKSRLKNNRGKLRTLKIDYLFYSLLNLILENYSFVLNHLTSEIDSIEKLVIKKLPTKEKDPPSDHYLDSKSNNQTLRLLFQIRHQMLSFRIFCLPLKEMIIKLQKTHDRISVVDQRSTHYRRQYRRKKRVKRINLSGKYFFNPNSVDRHFHHHYQTTEIFHEYIFIYFKDLFDQIILLNDRIDQFCDLLSSLTILYIILIDARRNQIMTCLSSVSIIFIPLNFILSSFSMNFQTMPPLEWHYAYYLLLALVGTIGLLTFSFFKWKKWL